VPARNRKDLLDVPEEVRSQIEFVWLEKVDDALEAALAEHRHQRVPEELALS
jgi:ATP-dependent Lon protease